ncbi:nucleotide pyrophosphohydrolase [Caldiplasma sukawensis]
MIKRVATFIDEREWRQFQTSKDIAESISVESGELLENFLWKSGESADKEFENSEKFRKKIMGEVSDILFGCAALADHLGFTLDEAFNEKMEKLKERYTIEISKGKNIKIPEFHDNKK